MSLVSRLASPLAILAVLAAPVVPVARAADGAVYPPGSRPHGVSYGEWQARWWAWAMATPAGVNPIADPDGADCGIGQEGPVWFLAGTGGTTVTRTCTVPKGKSIGFALVTFLNDYPCPDASFEPAPGQTVEDFLAEGAAGIIDLTDTLTAELDGVAIADPYSYRVASGLFRFTAAGDMDTFDPCATGSPQLGVTDGFFLVLKPLAPGEHVLHFTGGISAFPFFMDVTWILTIEG